MKNIDRWKKCFKSRTVVYPPLRGMVMTFGLRLKNLSTSHTRKPGSQLFTDIFFKMLRKCPPNSFISIWHLINVQSSNSEKNHSKISDLVPDWIHKWIPDKFGQSSPLGYISSIGWIIQIQSVPLRGRNQTTAKTTANVTTTTKGNKGSNKTVIRDRQ